MRDLCALLRERPQAFCRDCGDDPCVCCDVLAKRELRLRRELRDETDLAFAEGRARWAARLERERAGASGEE